MRASVLRDAHCLRLYEVALDSGHRAAFDLENSYASRAKQANNRPKLRSSSHRSSSIPRAPRAAPTACPTAGAYDARALATVEPTGSAPSLRPRNGMRHGAGCRAQRPRNGGLCGPHPPRPAQPLLRRAALHHGGEQLARAQRAYEPSSLGAARAPPLGSAQRRRVPAPASHPHQRCQRCCGLGSSAVLTVGCARLSNDRQARRSRS